MQFFPIETNSDEIQQLSHKHFLPIFTPNHLKVKRFLNQGKGFEATT
jgi:hypothetical protein